MSCDGTTCLSEYTTSGDGTCDEPFNCSFYDNDGEDCCPIGQVTNCDGGCTTETWLADGYCDSALFCAELNYDDGDCPVCGDGVCADAESPFECPEDCESPCADGEVLSCECCENLGIPGCGANAECESLICAADAFCCGNTWDTICAAAAEQEQACICTAP